jgi:hypothetical protein
MKEIISAMPRMPSRSDYATDLLKKGPEMKIGRRGRDDEVDTRAVVLLERFLNACHDSLKNYGDGSAASEFAHGRLSGFIQAIQLLPSEQYERIVRTARANSR